MKEKKIILTGDRPTGSLHIGHYIGSLSNRVKLQDEYEQYILIADQQALTDNFDNPEKVRANILEVALDYLAVGIDPGKVEGNPVFIYLEAFGKDKDKIRELKEHYKRGGLGDVVLKKYLNEVMQEILEPIRKKRKIYEENKDEVVKILKKGTEKSRIITSETLDEVKEAMNIKYF